MVAGTGFEPMTSRLCVPSTVFTALDLRRDLWSGLSLHLTKVALSFRCLPSSLYTFPPINFWRTWLGIAISGFTEFDRFHPIVSDWAAHLIEPDELPGCSTPHREAIIPRSNWIATLN